MKLVSMKRTEKMEDKALVCSPSDEAYPYGLRMYVDNDMLSKLGVKELPAVGKSFKMMAMVEVCSVSMNESKEGGEHKSITLQITDMGLDLGKKEVDAKKLYPDKA